MMHPRTKDHIASLFSYGDWANQRLLSVADTLTREELTRDLLPGFGSIHLTLAHMIGAEELWFARWQGESPTSMVGPEEMPTIAAMRSRWAEIVRQRDEYFAVASETEMTATVSWTNMRGSQFSLPRWQVMLHCANHAAHHRSEVAAMLSQLGHPPESLDLLEFYLASAGQSWKPTGS